MKKMDVSVRKSACRAVFALGCFVFVQLAAAGDARGESPGKVEGFDLLGTLGYGTAFRALNSSNKEFDPFGVTVGGDFGYTWPFGLRLGTDAAYAFGHRIEQQRWNGEVYTTHVSSITWGGSLGYDLLMSSLRFRAAADVGLLLAFDEGSVAPWMYTGPKIAFIWQYRGVELGLQSRLMLMTGAFQVGVMGGTRF